MSGALKMTRSTNAVVAEMTAEPSAAALRSPVKRYFMATRPPFLTITLFGCLLGIATAHADGAELNAATAVTTVVLAMLLNAAVNVSNDYWDHLNGSDALNTRRVFPFTGGSRFIQNGVISPRATLWLARALFAATIVGGLVLAWLVGAGLLWIGIFGVITGWAYSAEPLRLNSRGLGEVCVVLTFWLVVVGADLVQRGSIGDTALWAGLGYALLTANILYINQFPDREADLAAGKRHWVARMPVDRARWGYVVILVVAALAMLLPVLAGELPGESALGLLALIPGALAARILLRHADEPPMLAPALRLTIVAAHVAAAATAAGMHL
jgi:1,4-dihydroxy-2-naphthoate octaprenyltransferase